MKKILNATWSSVKNINNAIYLQAGIDYCVKDHSFNKGYIKYGITSNKVEKRMDQEFKKPQTSLYPFIEDKDICKMVIKLNNESALQNFENIIKRMVKFEYADYIVPHHDGEYLYFEDEIAYNKVLNELKNKLRSIAISYESAAEVYIITNKLAQKRDSRTIKNIITGEIKTIEYSSIEDARRQLIFTMGENISYNAVRNFLRGKTKTHKGVFIITD